MTDEAETLAARLEQASAAFEMDGANIGVASAMREAATLIRSQDAFIAKLQAALMFWMPSVTEKTDTGLTRSSGDDAYLLVAYEGDLSGPCWGDAIQERLDEASATISAQLVEIQALREALEPFAAYGRAVRRRRPERRPEMPVMSYPVQTEADPLGLKYGDIMHGDFLRAASVAGIHDLRALPATDAMKAADSDTGDIGTAEYDELKAALTQPVEPTESIKTAAVLLEKLYPKSDTGERRE